MRLWALSDLHLNHPENREGLEALAPRPGDWLALAGDVGETEAHLSFALRTLTPKFARVIWVPGNHELWTLPRDPLGLRGDARYQHLVDVCRKHGVLTPEDPYPRWPEGKLVIAPLFLLYDYSFRPAHVPMEKALAWAMEESLLCTDEVVLHPDPYPSRQAWCAARCDLTERRLAREVPEDHQTVLIGHFPLRQDLAVLPAIPRFTLWCGTRRTEDWHLRYRARVVVSGHLHIRSTRSRGGVRFEEVSLGAPRQWNAELGVGHYLREILPGPTGSVQPAPRPAAAR